MTYGRPPCFHSPLALNHKCNRSRSEWWPVLRFQSREGTRIRCVLETQSPVLSWKWLSPAQGSVGSPMERPRKLELKGACSCLSCLFHCSQVPWGKDGVPSFCQFHGQGTALSWGFRGALYFPTAQLLENWGSPDIWTLNSHVHTKLWIDHPRGWDLIQIAQPCYNSTSLSPHVSLAFSFCCLLSFSEVLWSSRESPEPSRKWCQYSMELVFGPLST